LWWTKLAPGQAFLQVLSLVSPVSVIPLMIHTHLDLDVVGDTKTNGQNMGPFYKNAVSEICQQRKESVFIQSSNV
jgi:hypothetical protein